MRLIDADALKETLLKFNYTTINNQIFRYIDDQPTIEAVPVVERNKIIDEFAKRCKADIICQTFGLHPINIDKIAEQMKGGTK